MMKHLLILLFCICSNSLASDENWSSFTYFERHDIEVRIIRYDPPITMESRKIPEHAPNDLKNIMRTSLALGYASYDNFDDWYETAQIFTTRELNQSEKSKEELRKNWNECVESEIYQNYLSNTQYSSYIYRIDYKIGEDIYTFTLFGGGKEPLLKTPSLEDIKTNQLISAQSFKLENEIWKDYFLNKYPNKAISLWRDIPLLKEILEAGYCYSSIDSFGLKPFTPMNDLTLDSVRESYFDEKVHYYPDPKERAAFVAAQTPYAPSPATAPPPEASHESAQVQPSAWLIGLLVAYGLVATIGWMRK